MAGALALAFTDCTEQVHAFTTLALELFVLFGLGS